MAANAYLLDLPDDARDHSWLEIDTDGTLRNDQLFMTDRAGASNRSILFRTHPTDERTMRIRVGSCPQWYGYGGDLVLGSHGSTRITGVRLVR